MKRRILFGLAALSMAFTLSADEPIIRDYGVVEVDTHVYMTNGAFVFERDGFYEGAIEVPRSLSGAYVRITVYDDLRDSPLDRIELRVTKQNGETLPFVGERRIPMDSNFSVERIRGHWQISGSMSLPTLELGQLQDAETIEVIYQRESETVSIPLSSTTSGNLPSDLSLVLNFFRLGK